MKSPVFAATAFILAVLASSRPALAVEGEPYIHDPSTVTLCDGNYYTFGTGAGGLISSDGWTWRSGGVRPGGGAAPDVLKLGDRYLVVYGATGGGLGGGHNGRILTMWNKTLDPASPDFKYTEARGRGFERRPRGIAMRSTPRCCSIPTTVASGSPTAPISASSASPNSIRRPVGGWRATKPSTSRSIARRPT